MPEKKDTKKTATKPVKKEEKKTTAPAQTTTEPKPKGAPKVVGTHLCTINAETLTGFITKATGRGLPHIVLRLNEAGIWVKQGCEMSYRYIFGKLSNEAASVWKVTDEVVLPIGNIMKFRDVIKMFKGEIALSMDGDDLVVQDTTKKFRYILFSLETVAGKSKVDTLETQVSFMGKGAEVVSYMTPTERLFELAKAFPLTEAKTIKFDFGATGFTATIREKRTHGMEMTVEIEPEKCDEKVEAVYDGEGFKEIIDRLTTEQVKLGIANTAKGIPLLGFVEGGGNWLFANYITPTLAEPEAKE